MTSDESRFEILKRVQNGTLSAEEGSDLIGILDRGREAATGQEVIDPVPPLDDTATQESPRVSGWWKALWSLILIGGAVLTGFPRYGHTAVMNGQGWVGGSGFHGSRLLLDFYG